LVKHVDIIGKESAFEWFNAIRRDERFGFLEIRWDAWGGDGFGAVDAGGHLTVEGEELGEEIGFGGKAVGGENSGIKSGVGGFEGVGAGKFKRAVQGRALPSTDQLASSMRSARRRDSDLVPIMSSLSRLPSSSGVCV
jgi:hypothetical protein